MAPLQQFILLGDSITEGSFAQCRGFGVGAELQNAYARRFDVINRGYSGYTSKNAVQVMEHVLPTPAQADVKFLAVWLGANDSNREPSHNQYIPIEKFKANLTTIVTHPLVKAHSPNIILITVPPVEETILWDKMVEMEWYGERRVQTDAQAYAEAAKEVGKERGIPVVDVFGACMRKAGWKEGEELVGVKEKGKSKVLADLLYDGLHMSSEGYRVVFDELIRVMRQNWPEYPPYKMAYTVKLSWELAQGDMFWDVTQEEQFEVK